MLNRILSYLGIGLLWSLHFLPLPLLARVGERLGLLFLLVKKTRREIATTNLALCFPELNQIELGRLVKAHFKVLGRSVIERNILWWASKARLSRLIQVNGEEKLDAIKKTGRPIIFLAPHFVGLDIGGTAVAMRFNGLSLYSAQKNKLFDQLAYQGRSRFGDQQLLIRQDGSIRAILKGLKQGRPIYYLPDMDLGRKDSIFVPFFGVPAATITTLSRLARASNAVVVPWITRILPNGKGYVVEIGDPLADFPTDDVNADTRNMNAYIERIVLTMPEQYLWVHKRFKTRPEGDPSFY